MSGHRFVDTVYMDMVLLKIVSFNPLCRVIGLLIHIVLEQKLAFTFQSPVSGHRFVDIETNGGTVLFYKVSIPCVGS